MALDPSVISGMKSPYFAGPQDAAAMQNALYRNQLAEMQMQEGQRGIQSRNALARMFQGGAQNAGGAQTAGGGQPGMPDMNAMIRAGVDPGTALELQKQATDESQKRALMLKELTDARAKEQETQQKQAEYVMDKALPIGRATLMKYDAEIAKGVPVEEAAQHAQAFYNEQMGELEKEGSVPPKFMQRLKANKFNPYVFRAQILQASGGKGGVGGETAAGTTKYRKTPQGWIEYKVRRDPATGQEAEVSGTERPLFKPKSAGEGGEGVGGSGVSLPKGVTEFVDPKTGKYYAMGKGQTWAMDEKGKWAKANRNDIPTKVVKVGSAAAGMGARESVFTQRVIQAGNQSSKDLMNVVELPISVDRGPFGAFGSVTHPSFLDAGKVVLGNKLTDEDAQIYNAMSTGFQRTLAAIESAGLLPSGSLTHQMDAVIFKPGDTQLAKLHKLAQTRQIIESGMEIVEVNPRVSEDEKGKIRQIIERVRKAVPYTHLDLIKLSVAQQKDPKKTLRDIMGGRLKKKSEAEDKPAAEGKSYAHLWRKGEAKRGSVAPANVEQAEDADEDSDTDKPGG